MIFSNDTAREQLLNEGIVATFRTKGKQEGDEVWIRKTRTGEKIAEAKVKASYTVNCFPRKHVLKTLKSHNTHGYSGFETAEEWLEAIEDHHGDLTELESNWNVILYLERTDD